MTGSAKVRRRKRDANEPEIIKALRERGCVVVQHSGPGEPDLFVFKPFEDTTMGDWYALEVKPPKGKLNEAQCAFHARADVDVVTCPVEAVRAVGLEW